MQTSTAAEPGIGELIEAWRPEPREARLWNVIGVVAFLPGLLVFGALAAIPRGGMLSGGLGEVVGMILVGAALFVLHEGIHGAAAAVFGGRPTFGIVRMAGVPALYTEAVGHRFTRRQYLVVALAPAVLINAAGAAGCLTPAGAVLFVPLAAHLAGCAGDLFIAAHVARQPADAVCEDTQDGVRFWRV